VQIVAVELELSHSKDESYVPANIVIRAGDSSEMLLDVASVSMESSDYIRVNLEEANDHRPVDVFTLRLMIMTNCANGKDSRIRGVKIYSAERPFEGVDFR
jgi:anaphase-promoting complex subunit 10